MLSGSDERRPHLFKTSFCSAVRLPMLSGREVRALQLSKERDRRAVRLPMLSGRSVTSWQKLKLRNCRVERLQMPSGRDFSDGRVGHSNGCISERLSLSNRCVFLQSIFRYSWKGESSSHLRSSWTPRICVIPCKRARPCGLVMMARVAATLRRV